MKVLASILQAARPASPGKSPGATRPAAGGNIFLEKAPVDYKSLIRRLLHRQARGVAPKPGPADKPGLQDLNGLNKSTDRLGAGRVWQLGRKDLSEGAAVRRGTLEVLEFDAQQVSPLGKDSLPEFVEQLTSDSGAGQGRLVGINGPAQGIWIGPFVTAPRSDSAKGIGTSEFIAAPRGEPAKGIGTSQFTDIVQGQSVVARPETSLLNRMTRAQAEGTQIEDATEDNPTQLSQGTGKSGMNPAQRLQALDIGPTVARVELPAQASQTAVNVLAALSAGERPVGAGQVAANVELGNVNTLGNTVIADPAMALAGAFSQAAGKRTHPEFTAQGVKTAGERTPERFGRVAVKVHGRLQQNLSGPLGQTMQTQASELPEGFQLGQNQQFVPGAVLSGQGNGHEQLLEEVTETPVVNQITQAFRAANAGTQGQLVIRLNPPELGEVRLEFQSEGKDLRAVLQVENSRTLVELQQEAPALIERLAQSGVEVRRMDIVLNQHSNTDSPHAELQEDQSGRGQDYAEALAGNFGDEVAGGSDELAEAGHSTYMQNHVSDTSINVWM